MRLLLVALCYLTGTWLAWQSVAYASSLFLWNNLFQPLAFAKHQGEYPVAYYVLVVLVFSYGANLFRGRFRPRFGPYFWCVVVIIVWLLISTVHSDFPKAAWPEFLRLIKYLLPLLLIYSSLNRMWEVRIVAAVLCASVGVWIAQAGVHCLVSGVSIDLGIPESQLSDRNDFTAGIVGTLPILIYFAVSYRWKYRWPVRIGIAAVVFLGLVAIVLSNSRGASVGLAATALAYVGLVSKKKIRDLAVGVVLVGAGLLLLPDSWYERMSTIQVGGEQKEASAAQRWGLMQGAWRATVDHPVFGLGPDGWLQVVDFYGDGIHNPHSIYLKLSSEAGFPGLMLFLGVMAYTFARVQRRIGQARRAKDRDSMRFGSALIMNVIGLLAAMTFLNAPFHEYLWSWVCLANAFASLYRPPRPAGQVRPGPIARGRARIPRGEAPPTAPNGEPAPA